MILEIKPTCEVRIVCWEWWKGKGVDDAIAAGFLDKSSLLNSALPYYEALMFLNTNIPAYKRITGKRYIELEDVHRFLNKYTGMIVGKDGGKTTTISKYLKTLSPSDKVLSITHRIKLGLQLAEVLALHYLNSKSNLSSEFQWKLILCINSLNIENVNPEDWKDAIVVLDEVVQLCDFIFSGTIKKAPEVIRNLSAILCAAKKVIIADADLDYKTLKLLNELMPGCDFLKHLKIYELKKDVEKIPMQVYKVSNKKVGAALYEEALAALIRGEKILVMTDSQRPTSKLGAETLKRALEKGYQEATGKDIRGLALYAKATKNKGHEASRIVTEGIDIVYQYDFVVYTTVIGTGVSLDKDKLDENPYFDRVIGGFSGAISINAILQGLHRYRRGVPRVVFIPNKGIAALHAGTSYSAKQNKFQTDKVKQDIQACYSAIISEVPDSDAINLPLLNYHSQLRAIAKYECDNYFDLFCKRAEKDYILIIDGESQQTVVPATLKETVKEVFQEYVETTVSAKVIESEERYEELKAKDVVLQKESEDLEKTQIAKKYRIESHEALINKTLIELDSNMGYHSGITNHYYMESYRLFYAEAKGERNIKADALDFEKYRKDPQIKVRLLLELGAQKLRESAGEKLHKFHPIVQEIIANYKRIDAIAPGIIYRHLHIALNEKDPMKMVDSLALKQGMTIHRDKKRKQLPNGERVSEASYTIEDSIRHEIFTIWDENNEIDMILNQRSEIRDTESSILEKIRSADVPDTEKEQLRIELSESGKLNDALQEQLQQINEVRNKRKEDYAVYHQIRYTNLYASELADTANSLKACDDLIVPQPSQVEETAPSQEGELVILDAVTLLKTCENSEMLLGLRACFVDSVIRKASGLISPALKQWVCDWLNFWQAADAQMT